MPDLIKKAVETGNPGELAGKSIRLCKEQSNTFVAAQELHEKRDPHFFGTNGDKVYDENINALNHGKDSLVEIAEQRRQSLDNPTKPTFDPGALDAELQPGS